MTYPAPHKKATSGSALAHYDRLLASVYAWMIGDRAAALAGARRQLVAAGVPRAEPSVSMGPQAAPNPSALRAQSVSMGPQAAPNPSALRALDLGAGIGLHAIPLEEMGYEVTAIDTSEVLLAEITAASPAIRAVHGDLLEAEELAPGPFEVIVCMGDTLTHLASMDAVSHALAMAARMLAPGGRLVLTFRDYVTSERKGAEQVIKVRSDENRVMTCGLEYEPTYVIVTDFVHERTDNGWELRVSSYRKVRLARAWVEEQLMALGLALTRVPELPGWILIAASKPAA